MASLLRFESSAFCSRLKCGRPSASSTTASPSSQPLAMPSVASSSASGCILCVQSWPPRVTIVALPLAMRVIRR
jgi:hypothetical protein